MGELARRDVLSWLGKGALGAVALGAVGQPARAASGVTALRGATLVDGTGRPPVRDATIVLAGDRILAAGRHRDVPRGVRVIDVAGKYVIPGLWDLHTHATFYENTVAPLHVVQGVTGIREMWGQPETHDTRRRIETGEILGPRMVVASTIVDGPGSIWPGSDVVRTPAEARAAVRRARDGGADFVKVYSFLSPECHAAVADEARRLRIPFAGHVPARVPVQDALAQHTHEHLYNLFTSTSDNADALYAQLRAMPDDPADPNWWGRHAGRIERAAVATHSPARARQLFAAMARQGTWQSPTLFVERNMSRSPETITNDPVALERMRYIPVGLRAQWQQIMTGRPTRTPEEVAELRRFGDARMRLLQQMHEAGVGVVAGTDAGFAYVFPGFSLHDELALLVQAGLSPAQALQAATRDAARCVGREHESGTVTPGKQADLVVLDADPLRDITNVGRVHAVVSRGRYLGPADRTRVLREIEAAAQEPVEAPATPTGCCAH
ncbi:amidohydrolase family protein [Lentzea flaviverrucosa]|uniref:Imidazolonepropionase n=1 Tax=Lentzea flaviverrucosa TaxID=200379 RepID=A0A1H9G1X5_9PSEU|nr:amidohydrolase family protein [Lentzea flaviverrucosa]RDI35034.1 imidazolonepropionase-like amidohydrolase [Lentzea flaviverrucosa]SEQ44155.1 Imidazolonepropionase [Lentzea flaviverrucosa]